MIFLELTTLTAVAAIAPTAQPLPWPMTTLSPATNLLPVTVIGVPPGVGPEFGDTMETAGGDAKASNVTVGGVVQHRGGKMNAALTSAVPLTVRAGCPVPWIVAVYAAALAFTSTPATLKLPPPHSRAPPE